MKAEIAKAVELLRRGRLVAFPTETVYGLGADALLFGEDASRILVAYPAANSARVAQTARDKGVPFAEIGEVTGSAVVLSSGHKPLLEVRVTDLKEAWSRALPSMVGEGIHHAALEGH